MSPKNPPHDAYGLLRDAIVTGRMRPGQPLVESRLANDLGMSRTPIREAIKRLEQEGLVQIVPYKGATVTTLSLDDVREIFELRAALEGWAARQAAGRIRPAQVKTLEGLIRQMRQAEKRNAIREFFDLDTAFHRDITSVAGNRRIAGILDTLVGQTNRIRVLSMKMPGRISRSVAEHLGILEALRKKDGELAEREMRTHILNVEANVVPFLDLDLSSERV